MSREHWEKNALDWAGWATSPGFDSYWSYSPEFFKLVPAPGRRTLEIGCGEGRVSRDLAARGHRVTAVDSSRTLISMARDADRSIDYVLCDAAALPFADGAFDVAVLYNSLMDFDDMEAAVAEAGRILEAGGAMCVSVTHPFQDAGEFAGKTADSPFIVEGSYLEARRPVDDRIERGAHRMHFRGWAYPMESYSRALEASGLRIEALREPGAPDVDAEKNPGHARWRRIPLFLLWRAIKTG
jgi:SAM-dependent methyltransferase